MSFLAPAFPAFFLVVWLIGRALPGANAKNAWLVAASLVFYGWVDPRLVLVLLGSTLLDYALALGIERWPRHAGRLVGTSVAVHLGLLAWFKYLDWALESFAAAGRALGIPLDLPTVHVLLPLGLSFYSFQSLGYVVDVYRGKLRARRNPVTFLAFATFFPQLVAGPIGRGGQLLPQLEQDRSPSMAMVRSGLTMAVWGAFMKVVIADTLAPWIDATLMLPTPPGVLLWSSSLAFGVQIYADLAGYTCLARGLARTFGIELAHNFREPYLAASTPDFWRRWHISMSGWIRDYILVPLMTLWERRSGVLHTAVPLLVTFLVIGMWHGAGWHYALFGLWHAAWVGVYQWVTPRVPVALASIPGARAAAVVGHVFVVLMPGTLVFNAGGLRRALHLLAIPPWGGDTDARLVAAMVLALAAIGSLPLLAEWGLRRWAGERWAAIGTDAEHPWVLPAQTTAWSVALLALVVFHRIGQHDFVYFRF
ncbi:MAG: MBOAT family protein [Alphaproteobacteria bacterium]|nr:MBOAT family protein [Alphaproteobacteria bacterium]